MIKRTVKKSKSSKKIITKRQSADLMEREFLALPAKISWQYSKELASFNQIEKKLRKELYRLETQQKASQKKQATLLIKTTPHTRKQLGAEQKWLTRLIKNINQLNQAIHDIQQQSEIWLHKYNTFSALDKDLVKFMGTKSNPKKPRKTLRNPTRQHNEIKTHLPQPITEASMESSSDVEL